MQNGKKALTPRLTSSSRNKFQLSSLLQLQFVYDGLSIISPSHNILLHFIAHDNASDAEFDLALEGRDL